MNFKENGHDVCVLARDSVLWKFNARLDDNVSIRCLQDTTLVAEGSSSTWRAFGVAMAKVRRVNVEGSAFQ